MFSKFPADIVHEIMSYMGGESCHGYEPTNDMALYNVGCIAHDCYKFLSSGKMNTYTRSMYEVLHEGLKMEHQYLIDEGCERNLESLKKTLRFMLKDVETMEETEHTPDFISTLKKFENLKCAQ